MGRSGLYTKSHNKSTQMETSMKNQNVRMAPADRTWAPAQRRRRRMRGAGSTGKKNKSAQTVKAKEAYCQCRVWSQNAEEDGEDENTGGRPSHSVAVLCNLRLELAKESCGHLNYDFGGGPAANRSLSVRRLLFSRHAFRGEV